MKLITTLILTIGTVFAFTSNADAESRVISQHYNWKVSIVTYDVGRSFECTLGSFTDGASFLLYVNQENEYSIGGYVYDVFVESSEIDLNVLVGSEIWNWNNVQVENDHEGVFYNMDLGAAHNSTEFRRDLMNGNAMSIKQSGPDIIFSLRGSAAAMKDLEECRQMITR